jgi:hypothetical protein
MTRHRQRRNHHHKKNKKTRKGNNVFECVNVVNKKSGKIQTEKDLMNLMVKTSNNSRMNPNTIINPNILMNPNKMMNPDGVDQDIMMNSDMNTSSSESTDNVQPMPIILENPSQLPPESPIIFGLSEIDTVFVILGIVFFLTIVACLVLLIIYTPERNYNCNE